MKYGLKDAWRWNLDPRDPECIDPPTEEELKAAEELEDRYADLDAYFED